MLVLGTNVPAYLASSLEIFFTASTPEHLEDGVLDDGPLEVRVLLLEPVDEVLAEHLDQIKGSFRGATAADTTTLDITKENGPTEFYS